MWPEGLSQAWRRSQSTQGGVSTGRERGKGAERRNQIRSRLAGPGPDRPAWESKGAGQGSAERAVGD